MMFDRQRNRKEIDFVPKKRKKKLEKLIQNSLAMFLGNTLLCVANNVLTNLIYDLT